MNLLQCPRFYKCFLYA